MPAPFLARPWLPPAAHFLLCPPALCSLSAPCLIIIAKMSSLQQRRTSTFILHIRVLMSHFQVGLYFGPDRPFQRCFRFYSVLHIKLQYKFFKFLGSLS
ncbi:hypothetical protein BDR06DRAFT_953986 [Suillus hirtellus]|nr:hypothetical protein BDR06DRAFT_953986 [Suillus hirtellus]